MIAPGKIPIQFAFRKEFKEKLRNTPVNWGYRRNSQSLPTTVLMLVKQRTVILKHGQSV